jgi:hypothetical protein
MVLGTRRPRSSLKVGITKVDDDLVSVSDMVKMAPN